MDGQDRQDKCKILFILTIHVKFLPHYFATIGGPQ